MRAIHARRWAIRSSDRRQDLAQHHGIDDPTHSHQAALLIDLDRAFIVTALIRTAAKRARFLLGFATATSRSARRRHAVKRFGLMLNRSATSLIDAPAT
jgi:hypothetical protein